MRDSIMRKKFKALYAEHFQNGILNTPEPRPSQVWSGDEIGFSTEGHHSKVFTTRKAGRDFRAVDTEKSNTRITRQMDFFKKSRKKTTF